jgi:hypothetical protein
LVIGGYLKQNYHRLLMCIGGAILLIAIVEYFVGGYWWLF